MPNQAQRRLPEQSTAKKKGHHIEPAGETSNKTQKTPEARLKAFLVSYNKARQKAQQMLEWIQGGEPSRDWANTEKTVKPIKHVLAQLTQVVGQLSPMQRLLLVSQIASMNIADHHMTMQMIEELEPLMNTLSSHLERVQQTLTSRLKLNLRSGV